MNGPDATDATALDRYESLDGQVALVTGATRGLGAEIARLLAARGATVYAGARDPTDVGTDALRALTLDVTDGAEVRAALDRIDREVGSLDVLVNNAGVYGPGGRLPSLNGEAVARTLDVNLRGPIRVARRALPLATRADDPRIVNVSSGAGRFAGSMEPDHLPYSVSKAGLNAFTRTLAAQYPDVAVNSVDPGWVRTATGGPDAPRSVAEGAATPVLLARLRDGPSGAFWRDGEVIAW